MSKKKKRVSKKHLDFNIHELSYLKEICSLSCKIALPKENVNCSGPPNKLKYSKDTNEILEDYYNFFDNWNERLLYNISSEETVKKVISDLFMDFGGGKEKSQMSNGLIFFHGKKRDYIHRKKWLINIYKIVKSHIDYIQELEESHQEFLVLKEKRALNIFIATINLCYCRFPKNAILKDLVEQKYFINLNDEQIEIFKKYYAPGNSRPEFYFLNRSLIKSSKELCECQEILFLAKHNK